MDASIGKVPPYHAYIVGWSGKLFYTTIVQLGSNKRRMQSWLVCIKSNYVVDELHISNSALRPWQAHVSLIIKSDALLLIRDK